MFFQFKEIKKWSWLISAFIVLGVVFLSKKWINENILGNYPAQIESVLNLADYNRHELEKLLEHYKRSGDEEKIAASQFLVSNCYYYFSNSVECTDSYGNPYYFDPTPYKNEYVTKARDSVFQKVHARKDLKYDCRELKTNYLIDHIDRSFDMWRNNKWKDQISFELFLEYLLPYRAGNEPLSDWSNLLYNKYKGALDTLQSNSILDVSTEINKQIAKDVKYSNRWILAGMGTQSIPQMLSTGGGMCDDLTVFGVSAMRAFGIPATVDFTYWAKMKLGHSWCVIFDEKGKAWSFGPGEQHPGEHIKIFNDRRNVRTLAKVFRKSFKINKNTLVDTKNSYSVPPLFRLQNSIDVTHEYVKTFDINIQLDTISNRDEYLYLCIWNNNQWRPIERSEVTEDGQITFTNVGAGLLFNVGSYATGKISTVSNPFIYRKDGTLLPLDSSGEMMDLIKIDNRINGYGGIKKGDEFALLKYINGEWEKVRNLYANENCLYMNNLYGKTMYRIENINSNLKKSRPFTVEDNHYLCW